MMQFTSRGAFPNDARVLSDSGALFGGSVAPFSKEKAWRSNRSANESLRCVSCGGYWWPGCSWRGNSFWICGLCGEENPLASGRMPSPDEIREFCILYDDEVPAHEKNRPLAAVFVVDIESEEALVDAAILAIGSALASLPEQYLIGLVVCADDLLIIHEFSQDTFQSVEIRVRPGAVDGAFRTSLADAVSISNVLCERTNTSAFVGALNSVKLDWRARTTHHSCLGRSLNQLITFLGTQPLLGARLFVFSSSTGRVGLHDLIALEEAKISIGNVDVGVGIDLFHVATSLDYVLHATLVQLVNFSGGAHYEHSFAQLDDGKLSESLKHRCEREMVFSGVIKTRACPELVVLSSTGSSTPSEFQMVPDTSAQQNSRSWWLVDLLKGLLNTLAGSSNGFVPQPAAKQNIFLGKGQTLESDNVWAVPMAEAEGFSLGFELNYTQAHGLSLFSFPRNMAVQVASSFLTMSGERFVRIETGRREGERPLGLPNELWNSCDYKQMLFVMVRVLLFSGMYKESEYKSVVLGWASRVVKGGCGPNRFEERLAKPLFGLIRLLEIRDMNRLRLLGECDPESLERLLWPRITPFPMAIKNPPTLKLKLSVVINAESSLLVDATSDMILILKDNLRPQEEEEQIAIMHELAQKVPYNDMAVHILKRSQLSFDNTSDLTPMGVTPRLKETRARDTLLSFLLEDSTLEWPDGVSGFVQMVCNGQSTANN